MIDVNANKDNLQYDHPVPPLCGLPLMRTHKRQVAWVSVHWGWEESYVPEMSGLCQAWLCERPQPLVGGRGGRGAGLMKMSMLAPQPRVWHCTLFLIYSFIKHLLNSYCVPGALLGGVVQGWSLPQSHDSQFAAENRH
jgi:hypothetical protein